VSQRKEGKGERKEREGRNGKGKAREGREGKESNDTGRNHMIIQCQMIIDT